MISFKSFLLENVLYSEKSVFIENEKFKAKPEKINALNREISRILSLQEFSEHPIQILKNLLSEYDLLLVENGKSWEGFPEDSISGNIALSISPKPLKEPKQSERLKSVYGLVFRYGWVKDDGKLIISCSIL